MIKFIIIKKYVYLEYYSKKIQIVEEGGYFMNEQAVLKKGFNINKHN